ncbi:MAG: alpha/beta hydrolase [Actinomycetota bacterium]
MARTSSLRRGATVAIAALLLVGVGCRSGTTDAPPAGSHPVVFHAPDGIRLEGRVFGSGDIGVVLSHMFPADQRSWWPFAATLADDGYLVLTFDFRGYCPGGNAGCSGGSKDIPKISEDVAAAASYLRNAGAKRIMLIGASMGGTASLLAAAQPEVAPSAIVTLSAPLSFEGLTIDPTTLQNVEAPKLFIAGNGDTTAAQAAQQLYDQALGSRRIEIVPTDDHGTDLLTGTRGEEVQKLITTYLAQFRDQG